MYMAIYNTNLHTVSCKLLHIVSVYIAILVYFPAVSLSFASSSQFVVNEDAGIFPVDVNLAVLNGNFSSLAVIFSTKDGTATCMSMSFCLFLFEYTRPLRYLPLLTARSGASLPGKDFQVCEKVMGTCTAQYTMLLFRAYTSARG